MKRILGYLLILTFLFCNILNAADVILNKHGHIITPEQDFDNSIDYYMNNGEYIIDYRNITLLGNSFWKTSDGFVTLTTIEQNVPTTLRLYGRKGNLLLIKKYSQVINLTLSENKRYTAFFSNNKLVILDNQTYTIKQFNSLCTIFEVDNDGNPIFINLKNEIEYKNICSILADGIRKIIFYKNISYIFTSREVYLIDEELVKIIELKEKFFDAVVHNNTIYITTKIRNSVRKGFILYKTDNFNELIKIKEVEIEIPEVKTHEPMNSPLNYFEENSPLPIGNSYGEIQYYGGQPYLHPGVDFLGEPYQDVYAVHDGIVKAVLTTGGDPYWRIAIANEDLSSETEGYLYAHLNNSSISVAVGDTVSAGEIIGTLFPWSISAFTHIHFARILDEGETWNGSWWTVDNPLIDVTNYTDSIPPIFENAYENDLLAFRDSLGNYLEPLNLSGKFDIICKSHDIANSDWKIDIWDLEYSLNPIAYHDTTLYKNFSYSFDMNLDTYFSGSVDYMILNTIYSRDETCHSTGNYDIRDYYHIITNSDGDSLITENDASQMFDSSEFADGFYYFKVTIRDASMNISQDTMRVFLNNQITNAGELFPEYSFKLSNYPNPFNPSTTIFFESDHSFKKSTLEIYNIKGQKIRDFLIMNDQTSIFWDGKDDLNKEVTSGIYFYQFIGDKQKKVSNKMILMK